ncbi:DUF1854 domain-containing protein [Candidatus Poribacteria bacterium]|nr:DUF1854 domain-containing protein [Candidatus Poribacteria bacterium]
MSEEATSKSKDAPVVGSQAAPPEPPKVGDEDDFVVRYLEPDKTRLFRSPLGSPRLEIVGEVSYPRVTVRRLRPLSDPEHYVSVWIGDDREIGIIRDPAELDTDSREIIAEELGLRYFVPVIHRIVKVKERFGVHDWQAETSRGTLTFSVRGLHDNLKQIPPSRLLVTDVRGNRYDIPDVNALDAHSYVQIQRHL